MEITQATETVAGSNSILLAILVFLPMLGAVLLAFIPKEQKAAHRGIGAIISSLVFLLSIPLVTGFDPTVAGFQPQWLMHMPWIDSIGASIGFGVDGISLWIVILTTFLTPIILLGAQKAIDHRVREFVIMMLLLETAMLGTLLATDLLLFYLFWEMMLIPMYLLIGIWGGKNRRYATIKFVVYTVIGSLLMLVGVVYLYIKTGEQFGTSSFDLAVITELTLSATEQFWLFMGFGLAFLIKVPLFPFHTWLPDAHTEAPTAGSVVLAGVLLKMGTYGLLRFALPLFPEAMGELSGVILVLSVIGIVYGALVAFAQTDIKKLVAYSSVSHLGFVMVGIVALNQQAVEGAILQMINHGISTGALFLLVGMIYERRHTRNIRDYGGIGAIMPVFTTLFVIVTMSSIGLPGTNGFTGEFMILSGAFRDALPTMPAEGWPLLSVIFCIIAVIGVVLGAIYMLSMVRRVFFGPVTHEENRGLKDMSVREHIVVMPLIALIFFIGFFPTTLTSQTSASVKQLIDETAPTVRMVRDIRAQKGIRGADVEPEIRPEIKIDRDGDAAESPDANARAIKLTAAEEL